MSKCKQSSRIQTLQVLWANNSCSYPKKTAPVLQASSTGTRPALLNKHSNNKSISQIPAGKLQNQKPPETAAGISATLQWQAGTPASRPGHSVAQKLFLGSCLHRLEWAELLRGPAAINPILWLPCAAPVLAQFRMAVLFSCMRCQLRLLHFENICARAHR